MNKLQKRYKIKTMTIESREITETFHTWIHWWSCNMPSRPTIVAEATWGEAPDDCGLVFMGVPPAGDAFHRSIPIFKLVVGIGTTGLPGTEAEWFPPVYWAALLLFAFDPEENLKIHISIKWRRRMLQERRLPSARLKLLFFTAEDAWRQINNCKLPYVH